MSKRHIILASAVLSMSALVASCGGGGGGSAVQPQQTPTTPPATPPATSPATTPSTPSLSGVVSFVRLSPAGAGQDKYFFIDQSGQKAEVSGLAGKDLTTTLYQFDNLSVVAMTSTNDVYCIDASKIAATDLKIRYASHAFGDATREFTKNRPFVVINATDGAYVITKDCVAKKITDRALRVTIAEDMHRQGVVALTNAFGIFQDDATNPSLFTVRSDGTFEKVLDSGANPKVRIDNSANRPEDSYNLFVVGDDTKVLPIKLVDDKGNSTTIVTSPLNVFGNQTRIQRVGNDIYVALNSSDSKVVRGYKVSSTGVQPFVVSNATLACVDNTNAPAKLTMADFDFDANGNLFVGIENPVGAAGEADKCMGGNNVNGKAHLLALYEAGQTTPVALVAGSQANRTNEVRIVRGVQTGAFMLATEDPPTAGVQTGDAVYLTLNPAPFAVGLDGADPALAIGASKGNRNPDCVTFNTVAGSKTAKIVTLLNTGTSAIDGNIAKHFTSANPTPTLYSVKNTRSGSKLLFGFYHDNTTSHNVDYFDANGAPNKNNTQDDFVLQIELNPAAPTPTASCKMQGKDKANRYFSLNLNRNVKDAIVMVDGANNLTHFTITAPPVNKLNVFETDFNDKVNASGYPHLAALSPGLSNCSGVPLVQMYTFTRRVCTQFVPPTPTTPSRLDIVYYEYETDSESFLFSRASTLAGISGPLFGDVSNNSPTLFSYLDAAANRGFVSFCPSGNTFEYLIVGSASIQYPGSGQQQVGFCFRPFTSVTGNGFTGIGNHTISVPMVRLPQ